METQELQMRIYFQVPPKFAKVLIETSRRTYHLPSFCRL